MKMPDPENIGTELLEGITIGLSLSALGRSNPFGTEAGGLFPKLLCNFLNYNQPGKKPGSIIE